MTAGIPGTGIGGLFYLVSALAMPLREMRGRRGGGPRWSVIAGQVAMASGVIAGMWATGWLLEVALVHARPLLPLSFGPPPTRLWPTATIVAGAAVLAAVLLGVEVLRLVIQRGRRILSVLLVAAAAHASVADAQDAPAFTVLVGGIRDSDRNATLRLEGAFEFPLSALVRLGAVAGHERVASGGANAGIDRVALRTAWRPFRHFDVAARVGVTRLDGAGGTGGAGGATVAPTGEVRVRWRPGIDLRLRRDAVTASPLLVANRVVRTEGRATVLAPLAGAFKLRGIGGTAALSSTADVNHRNSLGGAVVLAVAPAGEVSALFHEVRFSHQSAVGYFAPRVVQTAEVATYLEHETAGSALFVLDCGVGVRRMAAWAAPLGPWGRALRLYALITTPMAPGRELRLELDGEDSAVATDVVTAARWRYGSAALSVRWAVR